MWRWLVLTLGLLVSAASAAPYAHAVSSDPAFARAEELWSAAHDPASWRAAADAFFALAETSADKLTAARSGWAAARNAVPAPRATVAPAGFDREPKPRPLSELDVWFVERAERYQRLDPASPEAAVAEMLRANTLRRYDHLEEANALYLDIVATHRDHDVAEFAANLACDTFIRLEQFDKLVAFVDQLRADKAFLARFPNLAHTLHAIHRKSLRDQEPVREGSHEPPSYAEYEAMGERYLEAVEPGEADNDELLYNAMVSFQEARQLRRAIELGHRLLREMPRSRLAPRAVVRLGVGEADIGLFADAARDLERYVSLEPDARDTPEALGDALTYRIALGDLNLAARDLAQLENNPRAAPEAVARATLELARAELDAGRRDRAVRHVLAVRELAASPVALGLMLAELACPVALVDELCPRPLEPKLAQRAMRVLGHATDADDPDDVARRVLVDLSLETGAFGNLDDALLGYRELTGDADATAIVAHERLGRIQALSRRGREADGELALCITEARARMIAADWLVRCERERSAHGMHPIVSPLPEHLPALASAARAALEHI